MWQAYLYGYLQKTATAVAVSPVDVDDVSNNTNTAEKKSKPTRLGAYLSALLGPIGTGIYAGVHSKDVDTGIDTGIRTIPRMVMGAAPGLGLIATSELRGWPVEVSDIGALISLAGAIASAGEMTYQEATNPITAPTPIPAATRPAFDRYPLPEAVYA